MGSRLEKGSNATLKRIENREFASLSPSVEEPNNSADNFDGEDGEEYNASAFGGFHDYFRRKKIKLQNLDVELRSQAQDKHQIFKGIVAHVNGYTQPSLNDLHKMIVQHGGGFIQYLDNKTMATHIIASSLTPKKAAEFKRYRIVKPAWVVDSVKAGKLLPWNSYRVIDEGAGQRVIGFNNGKVVSEASNQSRGYKDQTDASWYTDQLKGSGPELPSSSRPKQRLPTPDVEDDVEGGQSTSHQPQIANVPQQATPISDPPGEEELAPIDTVEQNVPTAEEEVRTKVFGELGEEENLPEMEMIQDENLQYDVADKQGSWIPELADPPKGNVIDEPSDLPESRGTKRPNSDRSGSLSKRTKMTAEEHNAMLLADPNIRKSTVINPGFIEQYYRESRLHHLSTWKSDLKSQMQALASESTATQRSRQKRPPGARRYIMHVDFDSFFAAVSLKKYPQFKDKPAVVAHGNTSGGSEIASCNYPARKFGVTNGMWMGRAKELCPDLKVLPYDFPAYEEASRAFYEAIIATGGVVQSVSVDEALVDISTLCIEGSGTDGIRRNEGGVDREENRADEIAEKLRNEIKAKTECDVSVGIGGNILLAKLALRKAKPAGQYHLRPEEVLDFIGELQVQSLPGVAWSLGGKLEELGVKFVKDLREQSKERLITALGPKTGERLHEYARGIDRKEVGEVEIRKSVSAEVNWGVRFVTQEQVDEFVENLCGELNRRLLKERVKGKQLSLKVMRRAADAPLDPPKHLGHGRCDTYNKSTVLGVATNDKAILAKEALSMLKAFGLSPGELRGIGVQMVKLEPIKPVIDGKAEGSQQRLQFKMPAAEPQNPEESKVSKMTEDPIQDVVTPEKQKLPPDRLRFGADQLNESTPSKKPLNTLGTQFILPTQVDHQVLAELPDDIRAKLSKHVQTIQSKSRAAKGAAKASKAAPSITALPNQSQLDPEILNSLPEDIRSEILESYQQSPTKRRQIGAPSVLPQSPSQNRTLPPTKRPAPGPSRRGRGGKASHSTGNSTLTQSNFIMGLDRARDGTTPTTDIEAADEEYDPEFMAALPEDIRRELLDDQRRKRLQKTSLQYSTLSRKGKAISKGGAQQGQPFNKRLVALPARSPKPTFSTQKLTSLPQLRDAVSEWIREFKEEGPYVEDVDALVKYLGRVVKEEGDMDKAVSVVRWFGWVLGEELESVEAEAKGKWNDALERVKGGVTGAIRERGLGSVDV